MSQKYAGQVEIVGICDVVRDRAEDMRNTYAPEAQVFTSFEQMLDQTVPDRVVVVVPERYHAEQIIKALDRGCEVATEKPLCISLEECEAILEAERRSRKPIFMGFNYRLIPLSLKIRELVLSGEIGNPVSMDLTWYLDFHGHGVSYFRRWHRLMAHSGGLLITKATHHFDLANWWMNDRPERVFATGRQNFFGPGKNPYKGQRCSTCKHQSECDWFTPINLTEPDYEQLSQELGYEVSGVRNYPRDFCPFNDDVDIYDTMSVVVEYAGGGQLNYSLNASTPYEGWHLAINGTKGRLETGITDGKPNPDAAACYKIISREKRRQKDGAFQVVDWPDHYRILVLPHQGTARWEQVPNILEGHGGGDFVLMDRIFLGDRQPDPLGQFAGAVDGARSVAIGAGANQSIATGQPIILPSF